MNRFNWLGILAIGVGTVFGNSAIASPDTVVAQVGVRGVQSRINAPKSLTITPPPGSHIPLPQSNYNSSDRDRHHHHHHHHHHEHYHRRRNRGTTIIINPPVYNTPRHSQDRYIKIIRRR